MKDINLDNNRLMSVIDHENNHWLRPYLTVFDSLCHRHILFGIKSF